MDNYAFLLFDEQMNGQDTTARAHDDDEPGFTTQDLEFEPEAEQDAAYIPGGSKSKAKGKKSAGKQKATEQEAPSSAARRANNTLNENENLLQEFDFEEPVNPAELSVERDFAEFMAEGNNDIVRIFHMTLLCI